MSEALIKLFEDPNESDHLPENAGPVPAATAVVVEGLSPAGDIGQQQRFCGRRSPRAPVSRLHAKIIKVCVILNFPSVLD